MQKIPYLVTIGISGHRKASQLGNTEKISQILAKNFAKLKQNFEQYNPLVNFLIISPLAEGADRLFVKTIWEIEPKAKLIVPIPFTKEEYEKDFDETSKKEFRYFLEDDRCIETWELKSEVEPRDYFSVGKFVVDFSDFIFFIHDGSEIEKDNMDGGTGSVLEYTQFNIHNIFEFSGKAIPLLKKPYCYINTTTLDSKFSIEKNDHFYINDVSENLDICMDFSKCKTHEDFRKTLDNLSYNHFDIPASLEQKRFNTFYFLVILCAFFIGIFGLLDVTYSNFIFSKTIGSWDWMEFFGLISILLIILYFGKRKSLSRWLEKRYLAERLRHTLEFLTADIPLVKVLKKDIYNPVNNDLNKTWHSLYFYCYCTYKNMNIAEYDFTNLKKYLTGQNGLVYSQFDWHRKKVSLKLSQYKKFQYMRYGLLSLSILFTFFAALQIGGESLRTPWDLISGLLSISLALIAALLEQKEYQKISNRYSLTCQQFASVYKDIYYSTTMDQLKENTYIAAQTLMYTNYDWMGSMKTKDPDFS